MRECFEEKLMKKNAKDCFCALCRSPRKLRYARHLSSANYLQIFVLALGVSAALFPWFGLKVIYSIPVIWALFEGVHKSLYRKELKCPYCGFDPKLYRKNVKLTRQKVEEFLKQNPKSPVLKQVKPVQNSSVRHH